MFISSILPVIALFDEASYFLSLSETVTVEGGAPLWAGEGLWLLRLGEW